MKKLIIPIAVAASMFLLSCSNSTAPSAAASPGYTYVSSFIASGGALFASISTQGVMVSYDGVSWNYVTGTMANKNVTALAAKGYFLYAGTLGGVFATTNQGAVWAQINNGLPPAYDSIGALMAYGSYLLAGSQPGGVWRSTDNGAHWTSSASELGTESINAFCAIGGNLFAATANQGVYLSVDSGATWSAVNTQLGSTSINALAVYDSALYAGTNSNGVYVTTNNGASWAPFVNIPASTNQAIFALAAAGSTIFAGTSGNGVAQTTNNGAAWTYPSYGVTGGNVLSLFINGSTLYIGSDSVICTLPS